MSIRELETYVLNTTGLEACGFEDGQVFWETLQEKQPDLVILDVMLPVCLVALIAIVLSAVLAHKVSKKVMEPINDLDLEHPLENDTYEELSPLLNRIHQQHNEIRHQMRKLQRKKDEFEQVIRYMREGLVLLDKNSMILIINPAAKELFGADDGCIGKNFYELDRRNEMTAAVESAFLNGRNKIRFQRGGREYKFLFSRIESGAKTIGLVILALDITETQNAERNRREFSANVSHELKTPLQSIIGSAELLENGLVKPEDQPRFIGHIRKEATRLVMLIEDVVRISHLDEGIEIPKEEVDLFAVAKEIAASLQLAADKKAVSILRKVAPISSNDDFIIITSYNVRFYRHCRRFLVF